MIKRDEPALDSVFHALADANRRAIVSILARGECSIGELVPSFPVSFVAISKHVKVLVDAGLVRRRRQGRHQMCSLDRRGFTAAQSWLAAYELFWAERLDALDALIPEMKAEAGKR